MNGYINRVTNERETAGDEQGRKEGEIKRANRF